MTLRAPSDDTSASLSSTANPNLGAEFANQFLPVKFDFHVVFDVFELAGCAS